MKCFISNMYCKYVLVTLNASIRQLMFNGQNYKFLEDKLYESYIMLEGILNTELFQSK